MKISSSRLAIALVASISPIASQAAVRRVPVQYPTIQAAVDVASNGDIIRVASGTYLENVRLEGKAVAIIATEGPDKTVIDAGHHGRALTIIEAGSGLVTVSGFSLINGYNTWTDVDGTDNPGLGGAIYSLNANMKIVDNYMSGNGSCLGMAISTIGGNVTLQKNRIEKNTDIPGCSIAAIVVRPSAGSQTEISENVIADHLAIGLWVQGEGKVDITNNILRKNDGRSPWYMAEVGGLYTWGTELTLRNNLFSGNAGTAYGGAYVGAANDPSITVLVQNNSFTGNVGQIASSLIVSGYTDTSHRVTKNQFDDSGSDPTISCLFPIERDNVFASPKGVALQSCSVKP